MSAGNFFLYLNHDDHTDMRALATIESVSRPLRGEFIRVASVAGSVLYRIDVRLPPMLGAMFAGTITPSQFAGILALLRGTGETVFQARERCIHGFRADIPARLSAVG